MNRGSINTFQNASSRIDLHCRSFYHPRTEPRCQVSERGIGGRGGDQGDGIQEKKEQAQLANAFSFSISTPVFHPPIPVSAALRLRASVSLCLCGSKRPRVRRSIVNRSSERKVRDESSGGTESKRKKNTKAPALAWNRTPKGREPMKAHDIPASGSAGRLVTGPAHLPLKLDASRCKVTRILRGGIQPECDSRPSGDIRRETLPIGSRRPLAGSFGRNFPRSSRLPRRTETDDRDVGPDPCFPGASAVPSDGLPETISRYHRPGPTHAGGAARIPPPFDEQTAVVLALCLSGILRNLAPRFKEVFGRRIFCETGRFAVAKPLLLATRFLRQISRAPRR